MTAEPPRIVDTPEKAAAYARSLIRDTKRLTRIMEELPDYFEDLPDEARDELLHRIHNLDTRLTEFQAARGPGQATEGAT